MFDSINLPAELVKLLNSITPLVGIIGNINEHKLVLIDHYFPAGKNSLLMELSLDAPVEILSVNVLRKGEDEILVKAFKGEKIDPSKLKEGQERAVFYTNSVISFILKHKETLKQNANSCICIYDVMNAWGVAGLDPTFNDDVTLAKSLEVMAMAAVDKYVVKRKLQ